MPPPPPPPPPPPIGCDNPPPPRFTPGQNDNYPNGADILSCARTAAGVEAWHIDYPSVDQVSTDYPVIAFNAGDTVTLSASGCAQTGGSGDTWKRYVNPENDDGHESAMYYGTLQISGVTGDIPQPVEHWIGPNFVTPNAGHLVLGYGDFGAVVINGVVTIVDGHSDNGYQDHDDGSLGQCVGQTKATVDIVIDHNPRGALTCAQWNSFVDTPVQQHFVPEFAKIASLLTASAEVPLGVPITPDSPGTAITHFQVFQDGVPGMSSVPSNRPLSSVEEHADGCMYVAFTPTSAPSWYPVDIAFDSMPNQSWEMRPWDVLFSNRPLSFFQDNNRKNWLQTYIPGQCGGSGTAWRGSAARWMKICNSAQLPVSSWTNTNLVGFPQVDPATYTIPHSGSYCSWQKKGTPSGNDCVDFGRAEWTGLPSVSEYQEAEGVITNSFLSGGDFSGDHNGMPDGRYVGVHTDPLTHTDVDSCGVGTEDQGEHCADWEMNLLPDPGFRHLLARDESTVNDRPGDNCQSEDSGNYRKGNWADDLRGALGIEGEQWYYPLGFRPEPGDRARVRGGWIIDCGHVDWHAELHPASLLLSSYLQWSDYSPVEGGTWNRPLYLTNNWRSITGGRPATITKVILSPVFAEPTIEFDVWPPPRPCVGARFKMAEEDPVPNSNWSGVTILSRQMLPADGNPNHLHVTVQGSPFTIHLGGDGDVQNPSSNSFFTAYMAWWDTTGVTCPSPGGPGSGVIPVGTACAVHGNSDVSNLALVGGAIALASGMMRRVSRRRKKAC